MIKGKTKEAILLAARMLVDHGLGDWHIDIKDVTSYHAQTNYRPKRINYSSRFLTKATKEQFIGVTYHEIAHALLGGRYGHGSVFKAKCFEISGSLEYAGYATPLQVKRFLTKCGKCDAIGSCNSNQIKRWCRPCWQQRHSIQVLTMTPNPMTEVEWE